MIKVLLEVCFRAWSLISLAGTVKIINFLEENNHFRDLFSKEKI